MSNEREEAERALRSAIGREVGKTIHAEVTASFVERLRELDRVVSKATNRRMKAEENLRRAQATRDRSQAHLLNATRQLRLKDRHIAEMAELLERWENVRTWMLDDESSLRDVEEQERRLHAVTVETRTLLRRIRGEVTE